MTDNDITDDDKNLFRNSMRDVTPLKQTQKDRHYPQKEKPVSTKPRQRLPEAPVATSIHLSNYYTEEVGPNSILSYHIPGIPKKRLIELKNGLIRWEGRLDLHGQTLSQAQDKLCQFMAQQQSLGHRCVLIIHGKGSPTGDAPVLKNHAYHWLKQLPHVIAMHSALPRDGGSGALYVLLKRGRE